MVLHFLLTQFVGCFERKRNPSKPLLGKVTQPNLQFVGCFEHKRNPSKPLLGKVTQPNLHYTKYREIINLLVTDSKTIPRFDSTRFSERLF